jgi:hypothetical protein
MTADNGALYARKEGHMASWEGIERAYTCLCQRANGQAFCVDLKLFATTVGLIQTRAMLVLLHEYGICDVWLCEAVIYHTPGGISSLMTTYDSPIFSHKISFISFQDRE